MFRVLCIVYLSIILVLSELSDYIGFDLSTGLQSSPLSSSKVASITKSLNGVNSYKFYGHSNDHLIAKAILSASSNRNNIKFYIEIIPNKVNGLSSSDIAYLLSEWDDVRGNVEYIALGNEPLIGSNGIDYRILPSKLRMVYQYLQSTSGWSHVKVSIPFSQNVMGNTYPVDQSTFNPTYKSKVIEILKILKEYGGAFSANIYPFFVVGDQPNLLKYCLGNEGDWTGTYKAMIEAQYDAVSYAMKDVGIDGVEIIITETGWASSGGDWFATESNAKTYMINTLNLMNNPSSKLYGKKIFFFELFDEDNKWGAQTEKYFGVYDKYGNKKYHLPLIYNN